jgi:hypothetical protein
MNVRIAVLRSGLVKLAPTDTATNRSTIKAAEAVPSKT